MPPKTPATAPATAPEDLVTVTFRRVHEHAGRAYAPGEQAQVTRHAASKMLVLDVIKAEG